jgi:hypothetical protein
MQIEDSFFWFQQNSKNVYKKNLTDESWRLSENKDNYVFNEMFRVSLIGPDEALITGGCQGFLCSNATVHYKNGFFRKKRNMHYERRSHAMCKVGDFVFACGGVNSKGESLNSCEKFSLQTGNWNKISFMNIAKSHLSLCNLNNLYLFTFGGENKFQSLLDTIERYIINIDTWEVLNVKLPTKMECVACIHYKKEILILGGYSCGESGSLDTVFSLDVETGNNNIKKYSKTLCQQGWSIYQPIVKENKIHILYGGEEGYPPHHLVYEP